MVVTFVRMILMVSSPLSGSVVLWCLDCRLRLVVGDLLFYERWAWLTSSLAGYVGDGDWCTSGVMCGERFVSVRLPSHPPLSSVGHPATRLSWDVSGIGYWSERSPLGIPTATSSTAFAHGVSALCSLWCCPSLTAHGPPTGRSPSPYA